VPDALPRSVLGLLAVNRRSFLSDSGRLALVLAGIDLAGCSAMAPTSLDGFSYSLAPWTGDSFVSMHRIRDGFTAPLPAAEKKVDLLILGAGLSGLGLGYLCRDLDMMILERESTIGGNAKSGFYGGIEYALGSAYFTDVEEPFGDLYRKLGLSLKPLSQPVDSVWTPQGFVTLDQGPQEKTVARLRAFMKRLIDSPDYPNVPIQRATSEALKYDDISLYDFLAKDYGDYLPQAEEYCWTSLGGDSRKISAYIGLCGLSEMALDIYALPGGNATVARALAGQIETAGARRILTGQSVYRIEPSAGAVRVGFFDTHRDHTKVRCVEAREVVLACPYQMAARLVPWAGSEQLKTLRGFEYGSYLVANLCFQGQVGPRGYDHWAQGNGAWADFVDADFAAGGLTDDSTVLTVYAPFRNPQEGRALLLAGEQAPLASRIVADIHKRLGFAKEQLREVRLTRYGHQLFCSRKGVVRELLAFSRDLGRVHLCHSDGQGVACIESALSEAFRVEPLIRDGLHKR
jgi:phytoene dehydrogenase-like protein